jgi:hypothetical protein
MKDDPCHLPQALDPSGTLKACPTERFSSLGDKCSSLAKVISVLGVLWVINLPCVGKILA